MPVLSCGNEVGWERAGTSGAAKSGSVPGLNIFCHTEMGNTAGNPVPLYATGSGRVAQPVRGPQILGLREPTGGVQPGSQRQLRPLWNDRGHTASAPGRPPALRARKETGSRGAGSRPRASDVCLPNARPPGREAGEENSSRRRLHSGKPRKGVRAGLQAGPARPDGAPQRPQPVSPQRVGWAGRETGGARAYWASASLRSPAARSAALHWSARRPARLPRPHWPRMPDPRRGRCGGERDWWSRRPRVAAERSARRCVPTMAAPMQPTASWVPAGVPRGCRGRLRPGLRLPARVGPGAASPLAPSPLR